MNKELKIDYATKGTRFGNNFVDTIIVFFLVFLHAMVLDGWLEVIPEDGSPFLGIYFFVLYVLYHLIMEYYFGRTLGKYFTGTIVIDSNGNKPKFKSLLIRNLCRLIPFDPISFLVSDRGWHDSISETYVVNK